MAEQLTPEAILEIIGEHVAGFTTAATALGEIERLARAASYHHLKEGHDDQEEDGGAAVSASED